MTPEQEKFTRINPVVVNPAHAVCVSVRSGAPRARIRMVTERVGLTEPAGTRPFRITALWQRLAGF